MRFFPAFRHFGLVAAVLAAALGLWATSLHPAWSLLAALGGLLCGLGIYDLLQPRRAVLRNYPVIGHFRYLLEGIRPEIRQYFIESDSDELPFSRRQRSIVYQRAKSDLDKRPFGTLENVYRSDYEWINHSLQPVHIADHDFRVTAEFHPIIANTVVTWSGRSVPVTSVAVIRTGASVRSGLSPTPANPR